MFHVCIVALFWAFLTASPGDCSNIHLQEALAELTRQYLHLVSECSRAQDLLSMKLHHIADRNVTCNDGTPAGYYLRRAHGSKRWIVFLDGGEFCFNAMSCDARYSKTKYLMSSNNWQKMRKGTGILSPDPLKNPTWWNANHVYIPYCSSDVWSGNASSWETGERFSFVGTRILENVFLELMPKGLYRAKHLLLAGSSAGGTGVILNLDRIARRFQTGGLKVEVRGLADSGWYLDIPPPCPKGTNHCKAAAADSMIKNGMRYWRGIVPDDCARRYPTQKWKCYFGENVYRIDSQSPKHSPLFVFQWLYDSAQLAWSLSARSLRHLSGESVNRVMYIGTRVRDSFLVLNRTRGLSCAVFAPSCVAHTILSSDDWLKVLVGGKNLNQALNDWYQSSGPTSLGCKILIEKCLTPHCAKTCPASAQRSPGVLLQAGSGTVAPSRSTK